MSAADRSLHRDERGAVMVTGVFMGAFLIGATWLVFGIARAAIFRERVQETADAAAFSSAVLHAKGMNLIAAINLVFFAITAIWLVLRTLEHVMAGVQAVIGNSTNCHGAGCHISNPCELRAVALALSGVGTGAAASVCKVAYVLQEVRDVNKAARQTVGDFMDLTFPPLSAVQDVTARAAPYAGAVASVALGARFGHFTVAVSPSMIPADDLVALANRARGATGGTGAKLVERPLGLPVVPKKFGSLCNRTAKVVIEKTKAALRATSLVGSVLDAPGIKQAVNRVTTSSASYFEKEFCSDDDSAGHDTKKKIFKEKGPKGIFGHAENGNDLMQVWAVTVGVIDDHDAPKVATAGKGAAVGPTRTIQPYIAQAEFYFDCDGAWGDAQCNGPTENSMYAMKWRARLRRLRTPNLGAELGRYLRDLAFSDPVKKAAKKALGVGPKGGASPAPSNQWPTVYESVFEEAWSALNGKVTEAAGIGNSATGSIPEGSYH